MLPAELPLTPEEIKRLIKASGHSQRTVAAQLGVREAAVSKWVNGAVSPSHDNADKLRALSPRPTCQREWTTYVAEARARVLANRLPPLPSESDSISPPPAADSEAIAAAVVAKLPKLDTDAVATAVADKLPKLDTLEGKLDAFTATTRGTLDSADAKLDRLHATLNHTDAKVDVVDAKLDHGDARRDKDKRELLQAVQRAGRRAVLAAVGACVGCLLFLAGALALLSGRAPASSAPQVARAPEAVNVTQPVLIVAALEQGSTPLVFDLRAFLGAVTEQMGRKLPPEMYVPTNQPLPGQKPPPCLAEAGEENIGGGCWVPVANVKPPCGRYLFRSGDMCYRPVAADPQKPVLEAPRAPGQDAR